MIDFFIGLLLIVLAVIVHEFGHYLMANHLRVYKGFKIYWGCPVVLVKQKGLTINKSIKISLAGIIFGFQVLLWTGNLALIGGYLCGCLFDIFQLFSSYEIPKKYRNLDMLNLMRRLVEDDEQ